MSKDAECFSQIPKDTTCSKFLGNENILKDHNYIKNQCNILSDGKRQSINQIIPSHHKNLVETSCDMHDADSIASYAYPLGIDEERTLSHDDDNSVAPIID